MPTAIVTGSAGFIGFHLCKRLLEDGFHVVGVDAMTTYYDVALKEARHEMLAKFDQFESHQFAIETEGMFVDLCANVQPDLIVHLAAQAGVRYSLDAPRSYVKSNLDATLEVLEAARQTPPKHLMMASTSSVYGANEAMPYQETVKADLPMSFYAATKKANEAMAHSYAHLYRVPTTMFRFFTVYGPWGRPDMALFKFVSAILKDEPIDLYNHGQMRRDFTYVDDLVEGIARLAECPPAENSVGEMDTLSPVAPWRVVNIGSNNPAELGTFVDAIESALGRKARKNLMEIQPGDVPATWASSELIEALVGTLPQTSLDAGVGAFVTWYKSHYRPNNN